GVERRPTDVGLVDDVLHGQGFKPLFLNQRHQRAVEQLPRSLNASIDGSRLHRTPHISEQRTVNCSVTDVTPSGVIPRPRKLNIMFRNERPSIMNMSFLSK